ncbi:type I inositol polyphosphate 5-phosphatase 1 isoform X2 [Brassica rapa]|uniref:type I inositol polyphosphate 5-phosphatase 1 isoform X2 n=1 Tax=Brassica campestris TaxID=3711 RepID=UPI000872B7E3|nr:type I inositol polyphosphate 5-phosphatase 1 isoform X2 [Brassica rapa]
MMMIVLNLEDAIQKLSGFSILTHKQSARICAGTWNVGGTVPPADLDIDGWLDTLEPADIYVLGLQEIVPLNAGNIFGIEDDQPASEWENIIRDALNRVRPRNPKSLSHSDPPSPSMFKVSHDMFLETRHGACDTFFSCERPILSEDSLTNIEVLDSTNDNASPSMQITSDSQREERFSYNERVGLSWPEPPLKLLNQYVLERRGGAFKSLNLSIMNLRKPAYVRIVSKQMVGVFLTVWVRRSLRKHISNLSVSNVGVGIMGYIGNKGSVSVSMSIYQTPFCFLCSHLSSGEKDTDHQKRNDDVREIHRRTLFHPHSSSASVLPRSIRDHERVIWLGDLNYRINLSYEKTHELIARKEWQRLLENDQLSNEMRKGNVFEGWSEGVLCFPPTYKYEIDSENYIGDDPESGKRRPAWCDRVIWKGKGMKLLSYRRNEIKLSDHRPVTATFLAEVEVLSLWKLQRALAITYAEIQSQ